MEQSQPALILHGSWSGDAFFLWAESAEPAPVRRGRAPRVRHHPHAAPAHDLRGAVSALVPLAGWPEDAPPATRVIFLPSDDRGPLLPPWLDPGEPRGEPSLAPWKVTGLALNVAAALDLLVSLPLGGAGGRRWGDDLRYWSLVAKLALELLAHHKVLPGIEEEDGGYRALWLPVLSDPHDQARLRALTQAMPPVCRALLAEDESPETDRCPTPHALLEGYLKRTVDRLVRDWGRARLDGRRRPPQGIAGVWWRALWDEEGRLDLTAGQRSEMARLYETWREWMAQLQGAAESAFRLCFRLEPPEIEAEDASGTRPSWIVRYMLQANDDPSLLVPAETVWGARGGTLNVLNRVFEGAQERLLAGLGLAARLFPPILGSLRTARPEACALTVDEAYAFLREVGPLLEGSGFGVLVPPWWNKPGARLGVRAHLKADPGGVGKGILNMNSLVQFNWELALGDQTLTREEFERLAALKMPLVQVRGQWVMLQSEEIEAAIAFWEKQRGEDLRPLSEALGIALGAAEEADGLPLQDVESSGWLRDLLDQLEAGDRLGELAPPIGLAGTLRPYQRRGYSWLAFLRRWGLGACLADDMGLGKTIQAIALFLHERPAAAAPPATGPQMVPAPTGPAAKSEEGASPDAPGLLAQRAASGDAALLSQVKRQYNSPTVATEAGEGERGPAASAARGVPPSLVICPTSVVGNWRREIERFAPGLRVMVHHGSDRARDDEFVAAAGEHDVVISTFGLARRDVEDLVRVPWSSIVLDEAQNIKNPQAKQTQAIRRIAADNRVALTGTPVENRLSELWSIMRFLNPGLLGSEARFRKAYALPIERYQDQEAAERLKGLVGPFILRRVKTDSTIIQDLPDKLEMKVYCSLTAEQTTLYEAVVQESLKQIESAAEEGIRRRGVVLSALMRLKQVCNHPAQFLDDGSVLPGRSGKLNRLSEMLEEALSVGDRALIFTQFSTMGHMLQGYLGSLFGTEVLYLHGGTPQVGRDRMVARFQQVRGPPIFILSLRAGGTGLNLTGANHVFHYDRWWNPAVENQATDRAFRIGQTRDVQVHKYICAGTLEERIDDLIESKRALAESIISAGESWLTEMSTEELRQIVTLGRE